MNILANRTARVLLKRLAPATLLTVLLLLAACDSSSNAQKQPRLQMSAQAVDQDSDTTLVTEGDTVVFSGTDLLRHPDSLEMRVETRSGHIQIHNGYYLLSNPYFHAVGEVGQNGNTIRISIRLERDEPFPDGGPDIVVPLLYSAYVTDLKAGTYQIVVRHQDDNSAERDEGWVTVLEKQVTVP